VRETRRAEAWWVQLPVAALALVALVAVYLVLLRLNIDVTRTATKEGRDHRDLVYLAIHGALLGGALVAGFVLGKLLSGLGVAYAALFVVVIIVAMVGIQVGSHALACKADRNDIVRHWTC
jgi:hypothetical protein